MKTGEGSLHPQPKGWGIRDPPRSRCNKQLFIVEGCPYIIDSDMARLKISMYKLYLIWNYSIEPRVTVP